MQLDPGRMSGVCLPGSPPTRSRWRIAVYVIVFLGMLGAVTIGADLHTVAVTILAAGYVAAEIAAHLAYGTRPMPVTG
jgi:hypothetical protein